MTELRLYKEHVIPENELTDEMITLEEAGVPGAPSTDPEVVRGIEHARQLKKTTDRPSYIVA